MARQVSVIGSGAAHEAAAEEIGRLLAERGCTVVTGGLGEVMAAAHRGAKTGGGVTVAVLPGESARTRTRGPTMSSSQVSATRATSPSRRRETV